ncbi:MAG TPA: hypothetical protein PKJ34_13895 [Anaerolineaceae bacterium]|nr:hypothetical protein [Anaerolineaceae bacterium]HOH21474.1 hypothetical protein [Anaerolineaceae bacterium]
MDNPDILPIPKTKFGWTISVLMIALCFMIYYPYLFPWLESTHRENYWTKIPINSEDNTSIVPLNESNVSTKELKIVLSGEIYIPKFVSSYSTSEMIITITNQGEETINLELIIVSSNQDDQSIATVIYSLDNNNKELYMNGENNLKFLNFPPGASITRSIYVRQTGANKGMFDNIIFWFIRDSNGQVITAPKEFSIQDYHKFSIIDRFANLVQAITSALLLPPLSNVLIIFLALFSVYTIENNDDKNCSKNKDDKNDRGVKPPRWEWFQSISTTFFAFCKLLEEKLRIKQDFWEYLFLSFIRCTGTLVIIVFALVQLATFMCNAWSNKVENPAAESSTSLAGLLLIVAVGLIFFLFRFPFSQTECPIDPNTNTALETTGEK